MLIINLRRLVIKRKLYTLKLLTLFPDSIYYPLKLHLSIRRHSMNLLLVTVLLISQRPFH